MKTILMVAAHYPPMKGSSGLQRTLKFSEYLMDYGWMPIILSMNRRAHKYTSNEQMDEIPSSVVTKYAFALDAGRHFAIRGRYPTFLSLPDRWANWWFAGVPAGIRLIRKYEPSIIWSTFPIATAHSIGCTLSQRSGIPWIADFRDSMTEDNYPDDPVIRKRVLDVEQKTVSQAARCIFTADSARKMYAKRYPQFDSRHWELISNGFDEPTFSQIDVDQRPRESSKIRIVHSGLIDPDDRDPTSFFDAVRELKHRDEISGNDLEILLRASGFDSLYQRQIHEREIEDIVKLGAMIPYQRALAEMISADGLILFQGKNCNHQIPAKVYEYFRSGRPILGLVSPEGDTGMLLKSMDVTAVAGLENPPGVLHILSRFISALRSGRARGVPLKLAGQFSRQALTSKLAAICDSVSMSQPDDSFS